ncbi:olfactory receptor 4C15-like [Xenia sp. Carnegie-2017]|uniref:olfactory receptor 4C15-like n=1 Tax=Xenia sp. Carnegie-2017 TaxID=2897299 RepID=UPI001F036DCD|nr:olfactory receptor 4C15-like [Xenia sp. Carnegie-2017]
MPSERFYISQVFVIMFNSVLLVATVFLNGLAIVTIFRSSYLMGKPCYFIVFLQSIVDLMCSLLAMPLFLVHLINVIHGMVDCVVYVITMFATYFTLGLSSVNLLALTWERYVALLHPLHYGSIVTRKKLMVGVCFAGVIECFMKTLFLTKFHHRETVLYNLVKVMIISGYAIFAYSCIFLVVKKLARSSITSCSPVEKIKTRRVQRNDLSLIRIWLKTLAFLNSLMNSILFFWSKKMLRQEAFKLLKAINEKLRLSSS